MSNVSESVAVDPVFSREAAPVEDPGARTSGIQLKAPVAPVVRMKPTVFTPMACPPNVIREFSPYATDRVLVHLDAKMERRDARYGNKPKMK